MDGWMDGWMTPRWCSVGMKWNGLEWDGMEWAVMCDMMLGMWSGED